MSGDGTVLLPLSKKIAAHLFFGGINIWILCDVLLNGWFTYSASELNNRDLSIGWIQDFDVLYRAAQFWMDMRFRSILKLWKIASKLSVLSCLPTYSAHLL